MPDVIQEVLIPVAKGQGINVRIKSTETTVQVHCQGLCLAIRTKHRPMIADPAQGMLSSMEDSSACLGATKL